MTYADYISYHRQGDAGVEERMIASLCSYYHLTDWDAFRLIYYYTMTYHIPSALDMLLYGERDVKYSVSQGYLRLNRKVKAPFIRNMQALCKDLGMRFYVSDAHFKELCCNGSCCGLPAGWNYSKGQFCEALQIAKNRGLVRWDDVRADIESLHQYEWGRAVGFNANSSEKRAQFYGMSMAEYMRWLWNNPQAGQSPYKMFEGVLQPSGKDENGNIIYTYNKERTL